MLHSRCSTGGRSRGLNRGVVRRRVHGNVAGIGDTSHRRELNTSEEGIRFVSKQIIQSRSIIWRVAEVIPVDIELAEFQKFGEAKLSGRIVSRSGLTRDKGELTIPVSRIRAPKETTTRTISPGRRTSS